MEIRDMTPADWPAVSQIYREGMATGMATFETQLPSFEAWDSGHLPYCRFVALRQGNVSGWAALSPVSGRCVYGGVAEVSVYVRASNRGTGIGHLLLNNVIQQSERQGLWSLQSGIFPENTASIVLHKKMGFRYIGKRERIGQLYGVWKDNFLYERRSKVVGI